MGFCSVKGAVFSPSKLIVGKRANTSFHQLLAAYLIPSSFLLNHFVLNATGLYYYIICIIILYNISVLLSISLFIVICFFRVFRPE